MAQVLLVILLSSLEYTLTFPEQMCHAQAVPEHLCHLSACKRKKKGKAALPVNDDVIIIPVTRRPETCGFS